MQDLMDNFAIFFYTPSPDGGVTPATGLVTQLPGFTTMIAADSLMSLPFMILIAGFSVGILARIFAIR